MNQDQKILEFVDFFNEYYRDNYDAEARFKLKAAFEAWESVQKGLAECRETQYCEPKVGVGVFVCRGGKILLGKRKGSHGEGEWSLPGGHLDPGEDIVACCVREVLEETDIDISGRIIEFEELTNDLFQEEGLHYVTLFYYVEVPGDTEAKLMEEDKCEGWEWFRLREAPQPLFKPLAQLIEKKLMAR